MYEIKEIVLKNGPIEKKRYAIEFTEPKKQIVAEFLMSDAPLLGSEITQEINNVLAGEEAKVEFSGNRCHVTVDEKWTIIEDLYADVEGMKGYPPYQIDTKELLQLINMWLEKVGKTKS